MIISSNHRHCLQAGVLGLLCTCATGMVWAQSAIPFKRDSATSGSDLSRLGWGMLVSIALLGLVLFGLRRYLRQNLPNQGTVSGLQICESKRLGPRSLLHVVHFAGQQYLIGQSEQGLVCLANAPLQAQPAQPTTPQQGQGEPDAQT